MSTLNNTHTFTAAAAFGAAAIFSMLSFGGSAEAAGNPLSCHASSAKKVLECCAVMTNSPSKLIRTGRTCQTTYATYTPVCTNTYDCYLRRLIKLADESKGAGPAGGDGGRGHNSSNPN